MPKNTIEMINSSQTFFATKIELHARTPIMSPRENDEIQQDSAKDKNKSLIRRPTGNYDESCAGVDSLCMDSHYNDNSACQASGASKLAKFLSDAARKVDASLPEGVTFKICEFGCATGGSSILPLKAIKEQIAKNRTISATMVDLPSNDWDILKSTVEPAFLEIDFQYKPMSMYGPISDAGTVQLAYSCFAQHWLGNGAPIGLPEGAIWANQLPRDNGYRKAWEEASKRDWEKLLALRAQEVAPGGMMVFHIQSSTSAGELSERFAAFLQQVNWIWSKPGNSRML